VFSNRGGAAIALYELTDGQTVRRDLTAGDPLPAGIAGMDGIEAWRAAVLEQVRPRSSAVDS
jgi:hypothetical protein